MTVKNLINDVSLEKFEIGFKDSVLNLVDKASSEPEQVDGGIMFTLTDGQGKENRFSGDATIGANLDDLFNVFGVAKSLGNELKSFPEVFQYIMDAKGLGEQGNSTLMQKIEKIRSVKVCKVCRDTLEIDAAKDFHTAFDTIINPTKKQN